MTAQRKPAACVPERGEVIWIDHTPQAGREMRDHHPFLLLSTSALHDTAGPRWRWIWARSLIGPMPTALCCVTSSSRLIGGREQPSPTRWD